MKKYNILIIMLLIIETITIFLVYKTLNNKASPIEDNILKEEINNSTNFALMIEQDDGTYIESKSSKWPTNYKLNIEKSKCIDIHGNEIVNALRNSENIVEVTTTKTSYCYLFFDIKELTASSYLIKNVSNDMLWKSTLEDDGYRFIGKNPNNYICYGTIDTSTCTNNIEKYMYRIIGIFKDESGEQHLKLIKKEPLNTIYVWNADALNDVNWENSDLYKGINGSCFLNNNVYSYMQDNKWLNKIETWNYTATNTLVYDEIGIDYNDELVKNVYLHEMNRSSKTSSVGEWKNISTKIGLMYVSDYLLSLGNVALEYTPHEFKDTLKTGWIHEANNDTLFGIEWTMTKYGNHLDTYGAWGIYSEGHIEFVFFNYTPVSARPVFYLTSDVTINGEGTIENPYIITN